MNFLRIGIFLFCVILSVPAVAAGNLAITEPSENETAFAEMRDFYVYGVFPEPLAHPGNIRVVLKDESGAVVRTVMSCVNESGVTPETSVDMSLVPSSWGDILAPDAVTEPGGVTNGSNKVLVTDTYYLALVQGGATREMGSYTDISGGTLAPITRDLTAGAYTLVVEGLDGDLAGERAEKEIVFGTTHASLGSFRPDANKQNVIGWAEEKAPPLRVYLNWFPGYFRLGEAGYEIPDRWQANNAVEVANDLAGTTIDTVAAAENDCLVYNIGNTSATLQVELAAILKNGLEDSGGMTFTHYDIGEPSMAWTDRATGTAASATGRPAVYPAGTRVVYTRAEITDGPVRENYFNTVINDTRKTVDTTPMQVTVVQGENLTFYGVTRPIATTLTGAGSACRYIPDDRIATYVYENETLGAFTFTGCLVREFDGGYLGYANYEFGHAFTETAAMPVGRWLLAVSAYNTTGAFVERTNGTIELEMTAPSPEIPPPTAGVAAVAAPASTRAPAEAPGFGVVLALAGLLVAAGVRRG
ncbi:PGF-CTERM sorting domain-containing protein [Methanoculleus caldifontis]|nr:PGF-CTERM sorting domain-containing protein [Methanoculleus sp. Wushi-C6]